MTSTYRARVYFNSYNPKIGPTNRKHTQQNAIKPAPYKLPWFIQYMTPFSPDHTTHNFLSGSIFSHPSGSPSHMLNMPFAPGVGKDRFIPKSSKNVDGRPPPSSRFPETVVFSSFGAALFESSLTLFLAFFKRRSMAAMESSSSSDSSPVDDDDDDAASILMRIVVPFFVRVVLVVAL